MFCCCGVNVFASIESLTVTCPRSHHITIMFVQQRVQSPTPHTTLSFTTFNGNKKGFRVFTGGLSTKFTRPVQVRTDYTVSLPTDQEWRVPSWLRPGRTCSIPMLSPAALWFSPSSPFYLINRGNVFSKWSLNQFREAGLLLIIQLELYRLFYYWTETHQASFLELKCQILYRYMTSRNKYIKSQRKTEASGKL